MTVNDIIAAVDLKEPNSYSREEKLRWLSALDGKVREEVLLTHEGYDGSSDFAPYESGEEELLIPFPYGEGVYTHYLIAMIAAARGYKAVMVMPDTMSKERQAYMKAYGAELVLTPGALGMKGSVDKVERLSRRPYAAAPRNALLLLRRWGHAALSKTSYTVDRAGDDRRLRRL